MKAFLLCGLTLLALGGCAGIIAPFVKNPYAGTYSGTFITSDGKSGPASVTLTNIGNIFGDLTDTKTTVVGKLTGSIDTNLAFSGQVAFSGTSHALSGTFKKQTAGKLTGVVKSPDGYTLTLDIDPM